MIGHWLITVAVKHNQASLEKPSYFTKIWNTNDQLLNIYIGRKAETCK